LRDQDLERGQADLRGHRVTSLAADGSDRHRWGGAGERTMPAGVGDTTVSRKLLGGRQLVE